MENETAKEKTKRFQALLVLYHFVTFRSDPFHSIPFHNIPFHAIPFHWVKFHSAPYTSLHSAPKHQTLQPFLNPFPTPHPSSLSYLSYKFSIKNTWSLSCKWFWLSVTVGLTAVTSRTVWKPRLTAASPSAYTHPTSRPSTTTTINYVPPTIRGTPGSESSGSGGSTAPSQKTTPTDLHRPTVQVIWLIHYDKYSVSPGVT